MIFQVASKVFQKQFAKCHDPEFTLRIPTERQSEKLDFDEGYVQAEAAGGDGGVEGGDYGGIELGDG
jgi:hypothetical protein